MKLKLSILFLFTSIFAISCSSNKSADENEDDSNYSKNYCNKKHTEEQGIKSDADLEDDNSISDDEFNPDEDIYPDGTYSADIEYYNPETGYQNFYGLDVEVENDEVIQINFNNGGWLDDTHFDPERLSDGKATITDDRNREFNIELKSFEY